MQFERVRGYVCAGCSSFFICHRFFTIFWVEPSHWVLWRAVGKVVAQKYLDSCWVFLLLFNRSCRYLGVNIDVCWWWYKVYKHSLSFLMRSKNMIYSSGMYPVWQWMDICRSILLWGLYLCSLWLGLDCSLNDVVVMGMRVLALFSPAIDLFVSFGLSRRIEYCVARWEKM